MIAALAGVGGLGGQVVEIGEYGADRRAFGAAAQVGEDLADLGTVEEGPRAAHPVRHPGGGEGLLEQHELGVGAGQHGERRPRTRRAVPPAQGSRDLPGLVGVGLVVGDGGEGAVGAVGPQVRLVGTPPPVGQDGVGHRQHLARRAVVVEEAHDPGAPEPVGEAREVAGVGPVPRVDGLVGVADHAEVGAVAEPAGQQLVLRGVDVLELVDEQVPEPPPLGGRELGVGRQRVGAQEEQVVEVDQAPAPLLGPVPLVQVGHGRPGDRRPAAGEFGRGLVVAGPDETGLGPLDLGRQVGGLDGGRTVPGQERPEQPQLAVEQGGGALAAVGPAAPQLGVGDGVERAGHDVVAHAEGRQPTGQLAGGLAGEREGQDVAGVGRALGDAVADAAREHPRLPGPCAGEDAQRLGVGRDRLAL